VRLNRTIRAAGPTGQGPRRNTLTPGGLFRPGRSGEIPGATMAAKKRRLQQSFPSKENSRSVTAVIESLTIPQLAELSNRIISAMRGPGSELSKQMIDSMKSTLKNVHDAAIELDVDDQIAGRIHGTENWRYLGAFVLVNLNFAAVERPGGKTRPLWQILEAHARAYPPKTTHQMARDALELQRRTGWSLQKVATSASIRKKYSNPSYSAVRTAISRFRKDKNCVSPGQ
jgi:hypothetical protein